VRSRPQAEWRSTLALAIRSQKALRIVRVAFLLMFASLTAITAIAGCSGGSANVSLPAAGGSGARPTAGSSTPSPSASASTTPSPLASASTTPAPSGSGSITYSASTACINHVTYKNNVLPNQSNGASEGDFTQGFDRSWWGRTRGDGTASAPLGSWVSGFQTTWGRYQFDTYFGDSSDGTGYDPFYWGADTAAAGTPNGLRIEAKYPNPLIGNINVVNAWQTASATAPFTLPAEGGTLTVDVTNPSSAQNGWKIGQGVKGQSIIFYGTLSSGGAPPGSTSGSGSNPWVISNIHIVAGTPGTVITPGRNDELGFRAYYWPDYYSGTLMTPINLQYGFFVARVRLPNPFPALSPAFWILQGQDVQSGPHGNLSDEWDIQEMFSNQVPFTNQGEILWNSGSGTPQNWGGSYNWPPYAGITSSPSTAYHDYGVVMEPGGAPISSNYDGPGGPGAVSRTLFTGGTMYVDGQPVAGHIGGADLNLTANATGKGYWKEIMAMFQVAGPGTWLDPNSQGFGNPWPQYYWIQSIRVYQPTTTAC